MKKKQLNLHEAFWDFYTYVRQPEIWAKVNKKDRMNIYNAYHNMRVALPWQASPVGIGRLSRMIEKYAPHRYNIEVCVTIKG